MFTYRFFFFIAVRYIADINAIGKNHIRFSLEKVGGLIGRYIAHCAKTIGFARRHGFHGMLGSDIHLLGHFLGRYMFYICVNIGAASGEGSSEHCGMGCKYSGNYRDMFLYIKHPGGGHPFMKLRNCYFFLPCDQLMQNLNDFACCSAKQYRFDVVPFAFHRICAIILPQLKQQLIGLILVIMIDKYDPGPVRYIPPTAAASEISAAYLSFNIVP